MKNALKRYVLLEPLYRQALGGLPGLGTPQEIGRRFQEGTATQGEAAHQLVQLYAALCGLTGFVCGLPGFLALPVTVPTNVAGVALLHLHMCAALAVLHGEDPTDPATRERCIRCVLGDMEAQAESDETKGVAERFGFKLAERGARFVAEQLVKRATGQVVRRLPLLGGILGGASDTYATERVAKAARLAFATTRN